jgi:hypothetical protein
MFGESLRFGDILSWQPYPWWSDSDLCRHAFLRFPTGHRLWLVAGRLARNASPGTFEVAVLDPQNKILEQHAFCSDRQVEEIMTRVLKGRGPASSPIAAVTS